MSLNSSSALEAALVGNRRLKIDDDVARYVICSVAPNGTGGFTASEDPVLRFSYRAKDSTVDPDSSTFIVGFRETDATVWSNAAIATVTRDDSAAPVVGGTVGTIVSEGDYIEGEGRMYHITLRPSDLEAESWATGVEVSVDLEGGGAIELFDFRLEFHDRIV